MKRVNLHIVHVFTLICCVLLYFHGYFDFYVISDRHIESCSVGSFRFLCQVWAMCELSTLESSKIGMRLSKHLKAESHHSSIYCCFKT